MEKEIFKMPRSSYNEVCRIIRAYGNLNKPVSLNEISSATKSDRTIVSRNNGFLLSIGVIEGGNLKSITEKGKELAQALEHNIDEKIKAVWSEIILNNDFLNKMLLAVRIRDGMETSSLKAHIAYTAGLKKSVTVMTGAKTIVDVLINSGLVKEEDDRIIPEKFRKAKKVGNEREEKVPISIIETPISKLSAPTGVTLHIEVRIDAKPGELESLGKKLKDLIKDLSNNSNEPKKGNKG